MSIPSGTFEVGQFDVWTPTDLEEGVFGDMILWEDSGVLSTVGGTLTWIDPNEPSGTAVVGGADILGVGGGLAGEDLIEFSPGALYWNQFEIFADDPAGDGDYPSAQIEARPVNVSMQTANILRTDGDHYDGANAVGTGLYDLFWVAPDNGEGSGPGNNADDLIVGFNLLNVNANSTHGGSVTLHAARFWMISPDDPNNP